MIRRLILPLAVLAAATPLFAQTTASTTPVWVEVALGDNAVSIPAGTVMRYGAPIGTPYGCSGDGPTLAADVWVTPTVASPTSVTIAALGIADDPAPCYNKQLQILEASTAQTLTVNGATVIVPALPAPPATATFSDGQHTVVMSAVYPQPGGSNAPWFGAGNLLPGMAGSDTWESAAFNLVVDGQTLTCTYQAAAYRSNQFTFTCTAARQSSSSPIPATP